MKFMASVRLHEKKLGKMNQAFSPLPVRLAPVTKADGLGWDGVAPLALSFTVA